jgi:hypothetical protein
MAIPALKYMISGQGWPIGKPISQELPPCTVVDTSLPQWAALATVPPPVDAIALTQVTADWMTSTNGQLGLNYDPNRVAVGPGVVSAGSKMPAWYWTEIYNDGSPVIKP